MPAVVQDVTFLDHSIRERAQKQVRAQESMNNLEAELLYSLLPAPSFPPFWLRFL